MMLREDKVHVQGTKEFSIQMSGLLRSTEVRTTEFWVNMLGCCFNNEPLIFHTIHLGGCRTEQLSARSIVIELTALKWQDAHREVVEQRIGSRRSLAQTGAEITI